MTARQICQMDRSLALLHIVFDTRNLLSLPKNLRMGAASCLKGLWKSVLWVVATFSGKSQSSSKGSGCKDRTSSKLEAHRVVELGNSSEAGARSTRPRNACELGMYGQNKLTDRWALRCIHKKDTT